MKELTLNGKAYLATKRAAEITGYTTDYVGQLARQGKIDAQLVGRNWYLSEESITKHKFGEAKILLKKDEEERNSPALEVLVSVAGEAVEEEEKIVESKEEEVSIQKEVDEPVALDEMQGAWQEWYKAQKSVPAEEEEIFLSEEERGEVVPITVEQEVPIIKKSEPESEAVSPIEEIKEEVTEEKIGIIAEESILSPLPVQRSWSGTGLALAAVGALMFVGVITVTAGYVLTKGDDTPLAGAYQGVEDYVLGIQRFESK